MPQTLLFFAQLERACTEKKKERYSIKISPSTAELFQFLDPQAGVLLSCYPTHPGTSSKR